MADDSSSEVRAGKEDDDRDARQKRAAAIHALIDRVNDGGGSSADRPISGPAAHVAPRQNTVLIDGDAASSSNPARPDFRAGTEPGRRRDKT